LILPSNTVRLQFAVQVSELNSGKMSDPERYRFADILVDQTRKRVPVIVSTGSGSVFNTIEFSRYAEKIHADCLMVVPPQRVALPGTEVVEFFSQLCEAVQIPVMLQDADFTWGRAPISCFCRYFGPASKFPFARK
jgi:dihydrodipicolinate synthase/N-acetylneuraminate lyase